MRRLAIAAALAAGLIALPVTGAQSQSCPVHPLYAAQHHAAWMFKGTSPIPQQAWRTQIRLIGCQRDLFDQGVVRRLDRKLHLQHSERVAAAKQPPWSYGVASYYIDPPGSRNCCGFNAPQGVAVCGSGGGPCVPIGTKIEFTYGGRRATCVADDHGPFVPGREFDLDQGCAAALGFSGVGTVGYSVQ